jgi:hypothetical protein
VSRAAPDATRRFHDVLQGDDRRNGSDVLHVPGRRVRPGPLPRRDADRLPRPAGRSLDDRRPRPATHPHRAGTRTPLDDSRLAYFDETSMLHTVTVRGGAITDVHAGDDQLFADVGARGPLARRRQRARLRLRRSHRGLHAERPVDRQRRHRQRSGASIEATSTSRAWTGDEARMRRMFAIWTTCKSAFAREDDLLFRKERSVAAEAGHAARRIRHV